VDTGWQTGLNNTITDVPGIRVGHATDRRGKTGCTVILCEGALFAAVDARGGAPGTRETDVLSPANVVRTCHAVVFSGGSAFGLAAADGVMRWCAEHEIGFPTTRRRVPIVTGAVLYDLGIGNATAFPDAEAGYAAASRARRGAIAQGSVGAGTGATVAKLLGPERALKGGVGTASVLGPRGLIAGALVATNAAGCLFDPATGALVAGPRAEAGAFVPLAETLALRTAKMEALLENTTLMCVATNATLDHHQVQRLAIQAHDGFARVVAPAHTFADGDVAFALAMGGIEPRPDDSLIVGVLTAHAVEQALLRSVRLAKGTKEAPSAADWLR
jgi:L-aminopeptidase/D-esterase-like protein